MKFIAARATAFLLPLIAILLAATASAWADDLVTVKGALTWDEKIVLPEGSVAVLTITDPAADEGSPMIAEQRLKLEARKAPVPFEIQSDRDGFKAGRDYVLRAAILDGSTPTWLAEDVPLDPSQQAIDVGTVEMQPYKAPPAGDEPSAEADLRLQDLQGIEWVVEDINGSAVLEESTVTLHFGVDAKVAGKASCNSYSASYAIDGDKLTVSNAVSTRMACAPELMEQEHNFLDILTNAASLYLDEDGALVIEASGGRTLTARSE